jgi:hypothetical protein
MSENNNNNSRTEIPFSGDDKFTRLDNRTKLSVMASIIFGLDGEFSVKEAVNHAFSIDTLVGDEMRRRKDERDRILGKKSLRQF